MYHFGNNFYFYSISVEHTILYILQFRKIYRTRTYFERNNLELFKKSRCTTFFSMDPLCYLSHSLLSSAHFTHSPSPAAPHLSKHSKDEFSWLQVTYVGGKKKKIVNRLHLARSTVLERTFTSRAFRIFRAFYKYEYQRIYLSIYVCLYVCAHRGGGDVCVCRFVHIHGGGRLSLIDRLTGADT